MHECAGSHSHSSRELGDEPIAPCHQVANETMIHKLYCTGLHTGGGVHWDFPPPPPPKISFKTINKHVALVVIHKIMIEASIALSKHA